MAYVPLNELASIEGFDEDTAAELQARARDYLDEQNRKALEEARALGIEESLVEFEGLTPPMLVVLAKDGIKTLEDFATCADWELAGGWTTENGQRKKDEGLLEKFDVSLDEAQTMIMTARVMLGWVDPTEMEAGAEEAAEEEEEAGA
jgi:N utilization substance protein A